MRNTPNRGAETDSRSNEQRLVEIVLHNVHWPLQGFATVVVDPYAVFVAVSKATKTITLDVNGDGERKTFLGFLNTVLRVFSHALSLQFGTR